MSEWQDFELDRTIHDYDYTRRAVYSMNRIMDSSEFESMDADAIFRYLSNEMDIVLFPDFLKRYIYERAEIDVPFKEVPDSIFRDIIINAFSDNTAPFSLTETKSKKGNIIRRWLTQGYVKRDTVFVLGFGLRMPAEDVSMFLTKVIKEEDFDFYDPEEIIIWFCLKRGLPFSRYRQFMDEYRDMETTDYSEKTWISMSESPELFLSTAQNLQTYLMMLKDKKIAEQRQDTALNEFNVLYQKCCEIIAEINNREEELIDGGKRIRAEEITPGDVEKEICSGIPYNTSGNLEVMTRSRLATLFENKRMSRHRIMTILQRKHRVERFDLITLLFYIYAETVEPDWPAERYMKYIEEINEILHRCGMADIYPVNPYEAFVLMCLVTDFPLDVYAEIWEKSYSEDN